MTEPMEPAAGNPPIQRRCKARSSRTGQPCGNPPMRGAEVCHAHGGKAPQVRQAARRNLAEQHAADAVATYGLPVEIDPGEALIDEVHRTYGHVMWLLDRVREVSPEALVWGQTDETSKSATDFPGVDRTWQAKPNVWLDLYSRERDRLIAVTTAALKAGIDERRLRLAERDATAAVEAVVRALNDPQAGLSDGQRQALRTAIAAEFRRLGEDQT